MLNTDQAYAAKDIFISPPQPSPFVWEREQKWDSRPLNNSQPLHELYATRTWRSANLAKRSRSEPTTMGAT